MDNLIPHGGNNIPWLAEEYSLAIKHTRKREIVDCLKQTLQEAEKELLNSVNKIYDHQLSKNKYEDKSSQTSPFLSTDDVSPVKVKIVSDKFTIVNQEPTNYRPTKFKFNPRGIEAVTCYKCLNRGHYADNCTENHGVSGRRC